MHRTEIEKSFPAAKGFNTNLVQFLLPYHVIIVEVLPCSRCFITCMGVRFPELT